ncbi:MAG: RNA polymerase sigma factor region1.1 domain-containing protein, partial [Actinomycetota bacterium]|nr:RNA polymerase sigma factor region1.1 domain-containing protein [Actinomycetota bacterium]
MPEVTADLPVLDVEEVRALAAVGRERGYLSFNEISTALEEVELTKEQLTDFRAHLQEHGVEIVSGEERPAGLIEIVGDGAQP